MDIDNNGIEEQQNRNISIKTHMVDEFLKNENVETIEQLVEKHEEWLLSKTLPFGNDPREREMSSISYYGELPDKSKLPVFNDLLDKAELTTKNILTALCWHHLPEFSSMEYNPTITIPAKKVLADYELVKEMSLKNKQDWYSPMDHYKSSLVGYKPTSEVETSITFSVNEHWQGTKGDLTTVENEDRTGFDCFYDPDKDVLIIKLYSRSFTGWVQGRKTYGDASKSIYGLKLASSLLEKLSKAINSDNVQDKIAIKLHRAY